MSAARARASARARALRRAARRRRRARRRSARPSPTLQALATSALALPGLAGSATAQEGGGRWGTSYSFSTYSEDPIPAAKLSTGSPERYQIDSHQFQLQAPLTGRSDLALDFSYESMSGATPWYVEPGPGGEPLQVMTGATVEEQRYDTLLSGNYYFDDARAGLSTGFSIENDYTAINVGMNGERHFNEKNTTFSSGLGYSYDIIEPTDAELFGRVMRETKQSVSLVAGLSQVLGRGATIQSSVTYQFDTGFLSDPYKLVNTLLDGNLPDTRPGMRHRISWLTRYRQHVSRLRGTLHADYQLYYDDWRINSHTIELAWYQALFDWIRIIPSLRYYTQSQAFFYGPFFDTLPMGALASSDYRLSPFGALSGRIRAETRFRGWPFGLDWRASVSYERYVSSGDLAIGRVAVENPGLVSFDRVAFGLTTRF